MSENEPSQHEDNRAEPPEGTSVNPDRADAWEHPPATWRPAEPEQRDGRTTRQQGPVPPEDRLSHFGAVEHPAEMYAVMKPVPNSLPEPADTREWLKSFAAAALRVPLAIDLDPQPNIIGPLTRSGTGKTSSVPRWELRPEIKGMRCGEPTEWGPCRAGIGEPAENCPNTSNHPSEGQS
ncbi:hypothetical protein PL81_16985 [Streptomyces sp. RSD-27]|nr:hypothetical protein PL81_16985 [Streptomyces sp. RSD-27]